jgi:hypothetical protein
MVLAAAGKVVATNTVAATAMAAAITAGLAKLNLEANHKPQPKPQPLPLWALMLRRRAGLPVAAIKMAAIKMVVFQPYLLLLRLLLGSKLRQKTRRR